MVPDNDDLLALVLQALWDDGLPATLYDKQEHILIRYSPPEVSQTVILHIHDGELIISLTTQPLVRSLTVRDLESRRIPLADPAVFDKLKVLLKTGI
jgi:hypothetical protein